MPVTAKFYVPREPEMKAGQTDEETGQTPSWQSVAEHCGWSLIHNPQPQPPSMHNTRYHLITKSEK